MGTYLEKRLVRFALQIMLGFSAGAPFRSLIGEPGIDAFSLKFDDAAAGEIESDHSGRGFGRLKFNAEETDDGVFSVSKDTLQLKQ